MSEHFSILPAANPCLDPELVIAAYCRMRGVNRTELVEGFSKVRSITVPRHEVMWLLRDLTTLSQTAIGRMMGGRDQATVKAGIDAISDRVGHDTVYRDNLAQVRAYILAFTAPEDLTGEDAGAVIARRVMIDDQPQLTDIRALATALLAIGAILRSEELTDAEARLAALTLIRNAGGGRHG
jgi:hypothetical protein